MASKEPEQSEEGTPKRIKKRIVVAYLKTYRDFIKRSNNYCETTLEKLSVHPSSPQPDPFIRELSEEEFSGPRDRILTGWRDVEIEDEDEDMESHLEDFENEVEEDDAALLGAATSREPSRLKRFFTTISLRSHKSKGAAAHAEAEKRKTVSRRLSDFVNKEYDHLKKLKKGIGKALGAKDVRRSPRSSVPKTNTPVLNDPIATAIEDMVRDVHILQLGIRILESKLDVFEAGFRGMCIFESPESHGMMNDRCSKQLFNEMQDLLRLKLTTDIMVNTVDVKFKEQPLFLECAEKYEKRLLAQQKTKERVRDMTAGGHSLKQEEVPQKIQRKRLTVDDDVPKEMDHSPAKHVKKPGATWEEPKVGKLVDIDSPVKQQSAEDEKPKDEKLQDDEKPNSESEETDEYESEGGISNLMRKTSMEDLT